MTAPPENHKQENAGDTPKAISTKFTTQPKRTPLLPEEKLGAVPPFARHPDDSDFDRHSREGGNPVTLTADEHTKNNLPDVLARWHTLHPSPAGRGAGGEGSGSPELVRPRTAQTFCVPKADIAAEGYDLSLNRYKEVVYEAVEYPPPKQILTDIAKLETEIQQGMKELEGMLR